MRIPGAATLRWLTVGLILMGIGSRLGLAREGAEAHIGNHLAAGEFGPALAAARSVTDMGRRDALLQQIALAQADVGAVQAVQSTLAGIGDDRARLNALDAIRERPVGGARGGVTVQDFQPLIDLITSTLAPDSWEINGGNGAIEPFVAGVYVDSEGVLKRVTTSGADQLNNLRRASRDAAGPQDVRQISELRKVSLTRLEREVQLRSLAGQDPDEAMRNLAGLTRVQYVFFYPETGDIVLAGPAAGWHANELGTSVSDHDGAPVLQLDDLVVLLRRAKLGDATFGCSINPRAAHLERTQDFLDASSATPLKPDRRGEWLEQLRSNLGRQDVEVFGIDPESRPARILVEADYRMKLVGIGLEPGVLGVTSYLDMVAEKGDAQAMTVLRWWFAMNYDAVRTNADRSVFELSGQAVRLMSENEMLAARGKRVATGTADEFNQRFADAFTRHFDELAAKYPIYAELRNIFDLSLVAQLVTSEALADRADWHLTHFGDAQRYQVPVDSAPREVDSVANFQVVNRRRILAAVSGGVWANPNTWIGDKLADDRGGTLQYAFQNHGPTEKNVPARSWWWD